MKRRRFLRTAGGAAAGATLLQGFGCTDRGSGGSPAGNRSDGSRPAAGPARPGTDADASFRGWTWVHGGADRSLAEWRERFARLKSGGIDAVLVSGGETGLLAEAARTEGLEFHRWLWILNRSGDAWARENHPEWYSVSRNGDSSLTHPPYVDYYRWLCPTREPVREYLRAVIGEVARDPDVDGVHLDYIRHPDVILPIGLWEKYDLIQDRELPEFDFCYCDVCRSAFAAETGTDPLDLPDPPADRAWREFRWDAVTGVVRALSAEVRGHGKPITAAVFPTPDLARRLVRQAWDEWPLDAVFPMLYHSFYEKPISWIGDAVREGVAALDGRFPLTAGLYLPDLDPPAMAEAIREAREAGAAGFSLFEMNGISDAHLDVLREPYPD